MNSFPRHRGSGRGARHVDSRGVLTSSDQPRAPTCASAACITRSRSASASSVPPSVSVALKERAPDERAVGSEIVDARRSPQRAEATVARPCVDWSRDG